MNFEPTTIFGCVVSILNIIMYYITLQKTLLTNHSNHNNLLPYTGT